MRLLRSAPILVAAETSRIYRQVHRSAGQGLPVRLIVFVLLSLCGFCRLSGPALLAAAATPTATMQVAVGIAGVWKLGHVTPVRVEVPESLTRPARWLDISTWDGEGVAVTYRSPVSGAATPANNGDSAIVTFWSSVTIGRMDWPMRVRLLDDQESVLAERELSASELGQALPPTQPWVVALGSSLGVEATSQTLAGNPLPSFSTTVVQHSRDFPSHWRGLSGCDILIIATTGAEPVVADLTRAQWQAAQDWLLRGGAAVISLGAYAERLAVEDPLRDLLPGAIVERLNNISTSPLEASTATNVQLGPVVATRLSQVRGQVELAMLDRAGKRFPWWIRYTLGKGVIHFLGSDLDEPVLSQWKDRKLVWNKLLASLWTREPMNDGATSETGSAGANNLGYDDMIGQLRATLDYFPAARIFGFTEIALVISLILLIIGPLDYWLCVRWLRRPEWSWYFVSLVVMGSSVALIWIERISRPLPLLVNSAEIIDYLPQRQLAVVDAWTHVYSSRARTIDAKVETTQAGQDLRVDWQGLPGKGLGGMQSNLLSDQGMPAYRIQCEAAEINGVGIPVSGTKCIQASWSHTLQPQGTSQLRELPGIDQIEGMLVNPLPCDILNPVLMYHNWVYQLPSRLRPGEELAVTYQMVPKDLMRRLNRRRIINSNDIVTRWEPDDRQAIDRLLEIMMFYKASGGISYTHLQHRFQPRIDISNSLVLDQAVLFGKLAEPFGHIVVEHAPQTEVRQELSSTWCRVILPVARATE